VGQAVLLVARSFDECHFLILFSEQHRANAPKSGNFRPIIEEKQRAGNYSVRWRFRLPYRLPLFSCRVAATCVFLLLLAGSPIKGQQAGVLLVYGRPTSDIDYEYKTVWVVFSPAEAQIVATVPDAIVPRSTGFWRIGTAQVCDYQRDSWGTTQEVLWQTPIEKAPLIDQGAPCKNEETANGENTDKDAPAQSSDAGLNACTHNAVKLLFVSPFYISEEFNSGQAECDGRGGHDVTSNEVRTFDTDLHLSLDEFFGAQAAKSYRVAAAKGFAEVTKEFNCPEPNPQKYDLKSWAITHHRGVWSPAASVDEWQGECAFSHTMDLTLPKNVTGEVSRAALWPAMAAAVPHLSDFYLSPLGDYAIVITNPKNADYHIYAYSVQAGVLGKRLSEITWDPYNSYSFVMAQWSSGKYVQQWTDAIQNIKDHPLPAPIFKPAAGPAATK
jgi:hypothetical protein